MQKKKKKKEATLEEKVKSLESLKELFKPSLKLPNVKRVKSYLSGLDEMLYGGLVDGSTIIVVGGPGSGKTIMMLQYCYAAAMNGEKALFISTNEPISKLKKHAELFGWKDNKNVKFLFYSPYEIKEIIKEGGTSLLDLITSEGITKIALDSLTAIKISFNTQQEENEFIYKFFDLFYRMPVTSILTMEKTDNESFTRWEFMADGIIKLRVYALEDYRIRGLEIIKMRDTPFYEHLVPYYITSKGIQILPQGRVFRPKEEILL
ncbi:MAG: ATPase domain-containing protein [Candidatus Anstonellales archaeon]